MPNRPPHRAERPTVPTQPEDERPDSLVGTVLQNRYRVLERVGSGGMGDVYRAVQVPFERETAIKVLAAAHSSNKELVHRFAAEALIIAKLRHPNTLKPYDFGRTEDGRLYIVTEFVRGQVLSEILENGTLDSLRTVRLLIQLCGPLEEAHARGVVHRDLKPANIFVDRIETQEIVKVLDFGVAKVVAGVSHTLSGSVCGTPAYMSPEQAAGEKLDTRSDLYSLGVIAYECLAGRPPFEGETAISLMVKHANEPPPRFSELDPPVRVHPGLDSLVFSLLEKDRRLRPATALDVRRHLEAIARDLAAGDPELAADGRTISGVPSGLRLQFPDDATATMAVAAMDDDEEPKGGSRRRVIVLAVIAGLLALGAAGWRAWQTLG